MADVQQALAQGGDTILAQTRRVDIPLPCVAQVIRPAAGGIIRHVRTLTLGLQAEGYSCRLYGPANTLADPLLADLGGVPIQIGARTSYAADVRSVHHLARHLTDQADLVHAHGLRGAMIGIWAARQAGLPAVVTAHNLLPRVSGLTRIALGMTFRRAAHVIAVSEAVARDLQRNGVQPIRLSVVPNGIDLSIFRVLPDRAAARAALNTPPTSRVVLSIGRLSREKGFDLLIQAFAKVARSEPDTVLWLIGSGPEEAALRGLASTLTMALGDAQCIQFFGRQSDILPFLAAADIVAVPSRQEGQGIVAIEAMAAARPIVAMRVGGLVETVIEGRTGLLIPEGDIEAFASALRALLRDKPTCVRLGFNGRELVEERYSAETMVRRVDAIYRAVAPSCFRSVNHGS